MNSIVATALELTGLLVLLLVGAWWADHPRQAPGGVVEGTEATVLQPRERILPIHRSTDKQRGRLLLEAQAIAAHEWPRVWDDALRTEIRA